MGDRPWQQQLQPHDQQAASCSVTAGMMMQASATSSSIHGNNIIRKDPGGGYDMADLDHIFLYLNSQDQASAAIQEQPQTLNIFPSQPMHAGEPSPKGSSSMAAINSAPSNNALAIAAGSSKRPPAAAAAGGQPSRLNNPADQPSASGKDGKAAVVKKEGGGGGGKHHGGASSAAASEHEGPKTPDAKTLRRLAQNREAARKSRLRKKAYIQNLETSRIRLSQLEQELVQRSRTQGAILGGGAFSAGIGGQSPEAAWFDGEYARWVESHERMMAHMRAAVEEQPQHGGVAAAAAEAQLRQLVDAAVAHHGVLVELKAAVASADVFHLVSGTWLPAAERCFLWIGGFRPSELIKMMARHAEPLTEQQAAGVYGVQQSAREREEALDRDLHATHHALSDAVSSDSLLLFPPGTGATAYSDADALRLQTLYKLPQILTARQSARCFLAIADHSHRLRALTSLWLSRPRHPDQPTPPPPPPPPINPRN
uniref:DOG1 domain-containing protein n=1 Tax=Oryza glumipatula TaxID=40148 RepID=A0A0D9YNP4_9ORYZ